jgi:hypothetical protein
LIDWHCAVQIDPLVSSAARDLIERGKREALEQLEEGGPVICWMCGAEDGGTSCGSNCGLIVAEQPEQEPVEWCTVDELAQHIRYINGSNKMGAGVLAESLLEWMQSKATPLRREWVGLTDEERTNLWWQVDMEDMPEHGYGKAIEAALKEKNT